MKEKVGAFCTDPLMNQAYPVGHPVVCAAMG